MRFLPLALLVFASSVSAQTELATDPLAVSFSATTALGLPAAGGDAVVTYGVDLEGSTKRLVGTGSLFGVSVDGESGFGQAASLGVVLGNGRGGAAFTTLSAFYSVAKVDRTVGVAGTSFVHTRRIGRAGTFDLAFQGGGSLGVPVISFRGARDPQASVTAVLLLTTSSGEAQFVARPSVGFSATPANDSGVFSAGLQVGVLYGIDS